MIIDLILDRKDGKEYDPKEFYCDVLKHEHFFGNYAISRAMDYGKEKDVRKALCDYITRNGYNKDICKWVKSVKWLEPDNVGSNVGKFIIENVGGFMTIYPASCKDEAGKVKAILA